MPSNACNCNQCNQQQHNGLPFNSSPQFNFPLQQHSSNICGGTNSGGCNNAFNNAGNSLGIVGINNIPPLHQISPNPLGSVGLNSFHSNSGAFGSNILNSNQMFSNCNNNPSNLMNRCIGARNSDFVCADCINNNANNCNNNVYNGMNCNENLNSFQQNDCLMYGNYGQFGSNGCRLRRRRRNTLFSDALNQRRKMQKNNNGGEIKSNSVSKSASNVDLTAIKRKKETKNTLKKRQQHNKLKSTLKRKGKVLVTPKNKANINNTGKSH